MRVAVYRHQLFRPSETFITEQARHLVRTAPLLIGREEEGPRPGDTPALSLTHDLPRGRTARYWHALSADPSPFLHMLHRHGVRPALVHAHFGPEGVYAIPLARALGVPLVTTFHGFDASVATRSLVRSRKPSWVRYALRRRRLWREADAIVAVSRFVRTRLVQAGAPSEKIHELPIGIDIAKVDAARGSERPRPDSMRILAVARHVEKKGLDDLIRAVAALPGELRGRVDLVLIGEGPLRPQHEALARDCGLASQTQFLGARSHEEVLREMQRADVFCVPSRTAVDGDVEGLGMVFLEAAAARLPVVATRHGGIVEAVADGETGILVGERRPDALAVGLARVLQDPATARLYGNQGRAYVESRFDIRRCTARLEDLYLELIEASRLRSA